MALVALYEGRPSRPVAIKGARGICVDPACHGNMIAKIGTLPERSQHWAHKAGEACGMDDSREGGWHLTWKSLVAAVGGQTEVQVGDHRADAILPDGRTLEFQSSFVLSPRAIGSRERTHHNLAWVYRIRTDHLTIDNRNGDDITFTWLTPSESVLAHQRPVYFDHGDDTIEVHTLAYKGDQTTTGGQVWTGTGRSVGWWAAVAERWANGLGFHDPIVFDGLQARVKRARQSATNPLTVVNTAPVTQWDIDKSMHRPRQHIERVDTPTLGHSDYRTAVERFNHGPKCDVCHQPMTVGQYDTHQLCRNNNVGVICTCRSTEASTLEEYAEWFKTNVTPVNPTAQLAPRCKAHATV
jgi:hypothetical protein